MYTLQNLSFLVKKGTRFIWWCGTHITAWSVWQHSSQHSASAVCFKRMQQILLVTSPVLPSFGLSVCQRPVVRECPALTTCADKTLKSPLSSWFLHGEKCNHLFSERHLCVCVEPATSVKIKMAKSQWILLCTSTNMWSLQASHWQEEK